MTLNPVSSELKNAYETNKKVGLTYFTSYLILISKQTGQAFHESLMHFTKLFFNMLGDAKLNYLISSIPLFKEVLKAVLCDKHTITSKLEEEVIFSLISYCELGTTSKYKFDIELILEKTDEYIAKNGKFAKEVEETVIKIIEKHI